METETNHQTVINSSRLAFTEKLDILLETMVNGGGNLSEAALSKKEKDEVKKIVNKELDKIEKKITSLVKDKLKGKDHEKHIVKIASNVLENFYRVLWQNRSFWYSSVKNTRI